ncbi:MAG: TonB-dependent receptor [Caulobacter sp.]|nr:TonB-dependent receptor [Caulobacter sp.]
MRLSQLLRASASAAVLSALVVGAAHAQDERESATVDAIIITAQKREQSLQDVPVVVTAVSGQMLQDAGVKDIKDLTVLTPGLMVTSTTSETVTTARIRGVGTVGDNAGLESSVGVVIDGVYRPRNGVGFGDLGEMERIEVLKGPQGTLFGKNTSAGVINIISKEPRFSFGAQGEVTAGNYGLIGASASVTGPIVEDRLAGRLFIVHRERDGYYRVQTGAGPRTDKRDANQDFYSVRGQLLATPNDDLEIRVIADYTERQENCCVAVGTVRNPIRQGYVDTLAPDSGVLNPVDPFARIAYSNRPTTQETEDKGLSAEMNWDTPWLGRATLTSITAWRNFHNTSAQDSDFSTADIFYRPGDGSNFVEFEQLSQEFRLAGDAGNLNWLVGVFASKENLRTGQVLLFGDSYRPYFSLIASGGASQNALPSTYYISGTGQNDRHQQEAKGISVFTNNSYKVTDALELTMGLRYTSEEKKLDTQYRNTGTGLPCFSLSLCVPWSDSNFNNANVSQSRTEREWSGTVKAAYRFNSSVMGYVSYARGYKAGGFNLDRARTLVSGTVAPYFVLNGDTSFKGEFVDSYELGVKSTLFDRSVLLNASVFHQEYTGFQLNAFTGISFIVTSIPEVTSDGVDADFMWFTPIEGLRIQGGVTYADTKYGNFVAPVGASPRLPGNALSFAPLWSGSLSTSYERDLGASLTLRTSLSAKFTSEYNTGSDLNPLKAQDSLALLNGRIGIGTRDDRWTMELWGQNLTGEEYTQVVFDAPLQNATTAPTADALNAFLGAPRTYGVTLRAKF